MHRRRAEQLAPLLRRAEGVLTAADLAAAGVHPRLLDREVAAGRWTRAFPGVVVASAAPTGRQLALAALRYLPGAAVTGRLACAEWGLRDVPSGPVELLLPEARRVQAPPGVRLLRTTQPPGVLRVHGLRVVEPERALLDLGRALPRLRDVRAVVLAAVAAGHVDPVRARAALERGPRRGSGHLRRALLEAQAGAASAPEAELLDLLRAPLRRRRLELLVGPTLLVDGRVLCVPDAYLPALALGLEVDSARHHGSSRDLEATLRRHARVERAGVRLLHLTPWSLRRQPQQVLERVLEEARRPAVVPTGLEVVPRPVIVGA